MACNSSGATGLRGGCWISGFVLRLGSGQGRLDIPDMQTITLTEAQVHLKELVSGMASEGELVITDADRPVARLSPASPRSSLRELTPTSVGAVLRPFPSLEDDRLEEMLQSR